MTRMNQVYIINASTFGFNTGGFKGAIDLEELLEVVKTFYSMEGVPKVSREEQNQAIKLTQCMIQEAANAKAEAIFKTLDTNGDGSLDEEEFCEGCLNDPEFAGMIQVNI